MTARDLCSQVRITDVARGLGLPVRGSRAVATWRSGARRSVALCDDKGAWHDHATGDGGGVLELIRRVRSGDRRDAARWLADFAGVPLPDVEGMPAARQAWARHRAAAEREARAVQLWRWEVLTDLRRRRNAHLELYHKAVRWIIVNGLDSRHAINIAEIADAKEAAYQLLDEKLRVLVTATAAEWAAVWREHNGGVAA